MIDAIDPYHHMPGGNLLLEAQKPTVLDNEKNNTADAAQSVEVPSATLPSILKNRRAWCN